MAAGGGEPLTPGRTRREATGSGPAERLPGAPAQPSPSPAGRGALGRRCKQAQAAGPGRGRQLPGGSHRNGGPFPAGAAPPTGGAAACATPAALLTFLRHDALLATARPGMLGPRGPSYTRRGCARPAAPTGGPAGPRLPPRPGPRPGPRPVRGRGPGCRCPGAGPRHPGGVCPARPGHQVGQPRRPELLEALRGRPGALGAAGAATLGSVCLNIECECRQDGGSDRALSRRGLNPGSA